MDLGRQAAVVFKAVRRIAHVEFAFDDRFAAVESFKLRKHCRVLANDIGHRE